MKMLSCLKPILVAWIVATFSHTVSADEGMWLFSDLPKEQLKTKYGFEPTDQWARHVMLSSVRFNSGGSASFVSSRGLVLTNHHVGADTLHKVSTSEHNYYQDGFLAKTTADEIKAPDLELNQLVSVEDVTQGCEPLYAAFLKEISLLCSAERFGVTG